jgi:hypothetical protein
MSTKKHLPKKLVTDKGTDYLFDYFMNEEKFNEQLRGQWDEEMEKKMENHSHPNLDSRILTDKKVQTNITSNSKKDSPLESKESKSISDMSDVEFDDEESSDNISAGTSTSTENNRMDSSKKSSQNSIRNLYGQRIDAKPQSRPVPLTDSRQRIESKMNTEINKLQIGNQTNKNGWINNENLNCHEGIESQEERRARARDAYSKLEELVDKYGIKLTKRYTIDDDPDEMEMEYKMHRDRRNKSNQVKFYKQILLGVVTGVEFLNEKYNPFEFKLEGWSKQMASDMDDYTEILEEIYERWKDKGGNMIPEVRLLMMIMFSGVMYHVSQTLFGSEGLNHVLQNNPNCIQKLLGELMNNKSGGHDKYSGFHESVPTNKDILETIRKHNQKMKQNIEDTSKEGSGINNNENFERESKSIEEMNAKYEAEMKRMHETYTSQIEDLRNRLNKEQTKNSIINKQFDKQLEDPSVPKYQVLSDAKQRPRFSNNPIIMNNYQCQDIPSYAGTNKNDHLSVSVSNHKESPLSANGTKKQSNNKTMDFDVLIESLDESSDDLEDIKKTYDENKETSDINKCSNKVKSNSSVSKKKNKSVSDYTTSTTRRKNNILKL